MKNIDHSIFINTLRLNGITQKDFSKYAKIPYNTVTGWKKKGKVPAYAMVIARDMIYRKNLDKNLQMEVEQKIKHQKENIKELSLSEIKQIEAAFWGTNYTALEIIQKVKKGDKSFVKHFNENIPKYIREKILNTKINENVKK